MASGTVHEAARYLNNQRHATALDVVAECLRWARAQRPAPSTSVIPDRVMGEVKPLPVEVKPRVVQGTLQPAAFNPPRIAAEGSTPIVSTLAQYMPPKPKPVSFTVREPGPNGEDKEKRITYLPGADERKAYALELIQQHPEWSAGAIHVGVRLKFGVGGSMDWIHAKLKEERAKRGIPQTFQKDASKANMKKANSVKKEKYAERVKVAEDLALQYPHKPAIELCRMVKAKLGVGMDQTKMGEILRLAREAAGIERRKVGRPAAVKESKPIEAPPLIASAPATLNDLIRDTAKAVLPHLKRLDLAKLTITVELDGEVRYETVRREAEKGEFKL